MKYKITRKLILYFGSVLLLFSFVIGILFILLFTRHTMKLGQIELETRASTIASTLSEFEQVLTGQYQRGRGGGYGSYLKFLDDIAMSEVWLIDREMNFIQTGHNRTAISYQDLPIEAEKVINQVFQGESIYSESFSSIIGEKMITCAAPVYDNNDTIIAAVLLHSSVKGMDRAVKDGVFVLIVSLLLAFIIAVLLSIVLSVHFVYPLKKMEQVAGKLIDKDYTAKTEINQKDEIGSLAKKIDILSKQLEKASKEKEKLEQLRKDFISNISHELRTPVTVLRGSIEALNDEVVNNPEEVKEYYKQMLNDTMYLQRLVNDLLELSRLQNIDFKIEMEALNLYDVIYDVVRSVRMLAQEKQIELQIRNKEQEEIVPFYGDYGRIRQMFLIVLDNAIKFSPVNGTVFIDIIKKELDYSISITDYGKGISKEKLPYIFERFYHVKSEENKTGTGLGLAIAKQIAARHKIELTCESEVEKGTKFCFQFQIQ